MDRMDLNDQMNEYSCVGVYATKWWKLVFHFVLNVCVGYVLKYYRERDVKNQY
jgi:hypothetical protein